VPPLPASARILTARRLAARVERLRRRHPGLRVVLANGLFDMLHVGHVRYLEGARRLGDLLIVAVNDDRSARRLRGPGRPVVPGRDRARLIAALRCVDAVVIFGGPTVVPILTRIRPAVHCKGTDYTRASVPERAVVLGYGGRVAITGDPKRHATSRMIDRIAGPRRPRRSSRSKS
jgi:rfaE bifunctional protein nucleotidyltransferase chain/domain